MHGTYDTQTTGGTGGTGHGPAHEPGHGRPGGAPAPYGPADIERWAPEPDKRPGRTAFQRDRARVLHSAALRRLAGKTQVVAPGTSAQAWDASPRTRLTHSLECAQVGRELGAALGCDPDLVEAACLAHDLGHPPFGHNGERVLSEIAAPCGGFEGNAQSLRLLSRLEPKRFLDPHPDQARGANPLSGPGPEATASPDATAAASPLPGPGPDGGDVGRTAEGAAARPEDLAPGALIPVGLNLTRAALDAATKYPWSRGCHPHDPGSGKFGVYEDDLPVFEWFRRGAPEGRTCFEAQVMDWSDDVAYSVHDVEDGLHAGHLDPNVLLAEPERRDIFDVAAKRYAPDAAPDELAEALDRLLDQEWWPHGYDGSAVAQARLKDATSQLIGRFALAAEGATRSAYGSGPLTRYAAELVVPRGVRLECAVLKAVADRYVMQRPDLERLRAEQRVVLGELADALTARAPEGLDPQFRALYMEAGDDAARLRVVVDQIAALTDVSARSLHARLTRAGRRG
ncbi:deoxyguanosinetriphosphate triphosphohydrolase family protein [Streptomyces marispadix]|uniref:Deoxyguanosinetriphosphate triphosphohydrolase-like protein n=1 Tax=Streptomyces marispadix TaxID=2922868 RepID=A0ABS9SV53_9ACTN|nr:deoxyguanosinetriphosphate triphosphohydrolase family protein [Streptomyces marispadix]MCH6160151.1 deoxyguanosinetriphosphate triphosphohydrolase family protein [Streptomyces marispadix]